MPNENLPIRGKSVKPGIIIDGVPKLTLKNTISCNWKPLIDITEDDFLGEDTTNYDETYSGASIDLDFTTNSPLFEELQAMLMLRAKSRKPSTIIDITVTQKFMEVIYLITFKDVKFEGPESSAGGRKDKVGRKLSGKCSNVLFKKIS